MISASVRPYLQPRPLRFPGTFLLSEADFGAGAMTDFFQTSSVGGEIVAVNKLLHLPSVVIVGTTMFLAIIELMLWIKKGAEHEERIQKSTLSQYDRCVFYSQVR